MAWSRSLSRQSWVPHVGEGATWTDVLPVLAAVLSQGFPEVGEEELVSVPDAKFTKGEFEVSTPQGAPRGHLGEGRGRVLPVGLGDLQSSS